jgi:hypothetical protein
MSPLPKTDSISELARFWDTHDLTDFEGELEEVAEPVFVRPADLTVRLAPADARALHALASKRRVSEAELVSQWVHERVRAG